ncbi:MAG: hypothetical protein AB7V44_06515 [Pseudonocardia sp.]
MDVEVVDVLVAGKAADDVPSAGSFAVHLQPDDGGLGSAAAGCVLAGVVEAAAAGGRVLEGHVLLPASTSWTAAGKRDMADVTTPSGWCATRTVSTARCRGGAGEDPSVSTDELTTSTVRDRLLAAGVSAERIAEHLQAGRITVDGELVADLDRPAPAQARIVIRKT